MRRSIWPGLGFLCFVFMIPGSLILGQTDIKDLKLREWEPKSMLATKTTVVETPRFPVIDIHNHLGGGKDYLTAERVNRYLTEMNEAGVRTVVNLDGGWDESLKQTIAALDQAHPGRFATFALVNFDGIDEENWSAREAERLEESFKQGARGLKIDKRLGLRWRYKTGKLMPVDDPKLDPIWAACAKHQRPVVIHVSDPAAFFTPLDRFNERWHELNQHPNWLFFGEQYPQRQEILDQLHRVIAKHPETTFVNTHFGNNAEDLAAVGRELDKYPNMLVDFDARISELGRQPYTARKFFIKYQDRILFGTDTTPRREAFRPAPPAPPAPPADIAPSENISYRKMHPPKYPVQALRLHQQGTVVLKVLVGTDGHAQEVTVEKSSGSRILDQAAIEAVKGWIFNPGMKNGQPAPGYALVPISFTPTE